MPVGIIIYFDELQCRTQTLCTLFLHKMLLATVVAS